MGLEALEALVSLVESDTGVLGNCKDEPDDDSVGWRGDKKELPMTFGHVRRARTELDTLKARAAVVSVVTDKRYSARGHGGTYEPPASG